MAPAQWGESVWLRKLLSPEEQPRRKKEKENEKKKKKRSFHLTLVTRFTHIIDLSSSSVPDGQSHPQMQAAVAAMAAHTILSITAASPTHQSLLFPVNSNSATTTLPLHSSFHGVSLKLSCKFQALSTATAASAPKPLTVVAATKKAVAVLKGTSNVEGVVTLTQEDDGLFLNSTPQFLQNTCTFMCFVVPVLILSGHV